jgi:hypothetical protein
MAQTLLETGQHRLLVARLDIDHPVRGQANLRQRRREQIGLGHAPQHLACCACGDTSCEQCCRRTMDRTFAAACHLMQAAQRQPALRQMLVDGGQAERQDGMSARRSGLQPLDADPEIVDDGMRTGGVHAHGWPRRG